MHGWVDDEDDDDDDDDGVVVWGWEDGGRKKGGKETAIAIAHSGLDTGGKIFLESFLTVHARIARDERRNRHKMGPLISPSEINV